MFTRRKNGIVFWGLVLPLVTALLTHCGQPTSPTKNLTGGVPPITGCNLLGTFSGGSGTPADPYLISTFCDLQALFGNSANWTKSAKLTVDFNLQNQDVGYSLDSYSGILDGNGHQISNYQSSHPLITNLIGTIKNLTMTNAQIISPAISRVAILAESSASGSFITNVIVSGAVSASLNSTFIAGLISINGGTVQGSSANVSVQGGASVGGLAGHNNGTITKSYSIGSISGGTFAAGTIEGVGGFVGSNNGTITDCYSRASVSGTSFVGGFVGTNWVLTNRTYSSGAVFGTGVNIGGYVGKNQSPTLYNLNGTVTNSYWDTQSSGQASSAAGTGLNTSQMQSQSSYTGWDFTNTWTSPSLGVYPGLR